MTLNDYGEGCSASTLANHDNDSPAGTLINLSEDSSASTLINLSKDSSASTLINLSKDSSASTLINLSEDSSASTLINLSEDSSASTPTNPSEGSSASPLSNYSENPFESTLNRLKLDANLYINSKPNSPTPRSEVSPERLNTKPLFQLLAGKKERFNSSSTLNGEAFLDLLSDYPSPEFPVLLADIAKHGAKLGYNGPPLATKKRQNHPTAKVHTSIISDEIQKELSLGRLHKLGSLPEKYYCSPLGLVPKVNNGTQTGWRRIFDLSCPAGSSINDHIEPEFGKLRYETFSEAVAEIARSGKGSILMKRDLKSAFRKIPVSPEDQWLLIFEWEGSYYKELFLPFGLHTAPYIFNLFGEGFEWILQRKYSWTLKRYLDDFLAILPPGTSTSSFSQEFMDVCTQLGFEEALDKREEGTCVHYLGLVLDTIKMEARLPDEKKARAMKGIADVLKARCVTTKQLEKLLGLLEFCVNVFPIFRWAALF